MAYLVISKDYELPESYPVCIREDGFAHFLSPYREDEFVNDIKHEIPWGDRRWNEETLTWSVRLIHLDYFCERITYWYQSPALVKDERAEQVQEG